MEFNQICMDIIITSQRDDKVLVILTHLQGHKGTSKGLECLDRLYQHIKVLGMNSEESVQMHWWGIREGDIWSGDHSVFL